ncbi:alkylated DNA repair protein (DNA oxidative demethylase) [Ancylobacter sp. 3268]|uniref:alpha-ketoglutarate-dependent dioxygenase AlkB family protein n=1 Tax=Ancylobacter sp. 3268 TaxID=2817752 RepID=UPI00286305CB|nr:alpha-ketoglutarate-dependent dioxygenase AlkB [Ancylobacter sp. 3268]MDR6952605.1 alkylated DNA repair protein (DNA oxidative demethylase) [Ancylobacter sp. 3268]
MIPAPLELAPGCLWWRGYLDRAAQEALVADIREVLKTAPLFIPRMPRTGKPFSVRMSNCGPLGWVSDESGYRYQPHHPETGEPWPPFPAALRNAWADLAGAAPAPQACLINWYGPEARMGLHQDKDEQEFSAPVLSLSLGDTAIFRIGGVERRGKTRSIQLASGDALLLSGPSRLAFHGIDRILAGTSTLLSQPGRINLTLRRVHPAREERDAAL